MTPESDTSLNAYLGMYRQEQLGSNRPSCLDDDLYYHLQYQHPMTMEPLPNGSSPSSLAYPHSTARHQKQRTLALGQSKQHHLNPSSSNTLQRA